MSRVLPRMCLVAVVSVCFLAATAQESAWIDVPFVAQPENGCGAAVISMALQYWGKHGAVFPSHAADVRTIQSELYSPSEHGIKASAMTGYFAELGFSAFPFRGDSTDLQDHLEKGRPLIVALRESKFSRVLHYVVVVGIGPRENVVIVNDPARRKLLKMDAKEFQQSWAAAENWTLLVVPKR